MYLAFYMWPVAKEYTCMASCECSVSLADFMILNMAFPQEFSEWFVLFHINESIVKLDGNGILLSSKFQKMRKLTFFLIRKIYFLHPY